MKALGVKNRCRVRDIPEGIDYITAVPRMRRYMEASGTVVSTFLEHVSAEDMYVYSIDESFIDATPNLKLYGLGAREFAARLISAVKEKTRIPATAGRGPNMFLAKVALDVCAKHAEDGIGCLDDESWRREIWFHQPITDIWGIGPGTARRLAKHGVYDLAGVCKMPKRSLLKEFGVNGRLLLDHAWGQETCTIAQARGYKPKGHSLTNGQVLMRDYSFDEAQALVREMALASCLELTDKGLAAGSVGLYIGYSSAGLPRQSWECACAPMLGAGGSIRLANPTDSAREVTNELLFIYFTRVRRGVPIRRVSISLGGLTEKRSVQPSLFDEPEKDSKEDAVAAAMVAVRKRFGANAMLKGTSLRKEANARERNMQIGGHRA